ncbi:undecaprenyl/decaprenyl-phosphate alpha-N-acetylglucosaminyl 1-phosphate transferase [Streptomyces sp. cmx-18-6]|uniref:undecaprenyl/decaprenyl-phosphate alpha-N-acetylglucosaminyl 1-phosphate transferase n=1 Tax=Streptomyces sp. cmx-18-6 TaxID=2790930 RepID=UPI0039816F29
MNVLGIIASGVAALFITVALAKGVRRTALRSGAEHEPGGRRSRAGTARRLGGATVVLGVGTAAAAGWGLGAAGDLGRAAGGLLAGAAIVAVLGLVHDLRPLALPVRLTVHTAAATLTVCLAGLSPAAAVPAVLWIVLVANAFALLDTSHGALATVAAVTAAGLLACALIDGRPGFALLPAALLAGLIGFLIHNRHPARLHPGSCGSLFTGFVLASSGALIHAAAPADRAAWAALPVLATVAAADAALVLASRRRASRPLLRDGGDHIAHRLRRLRVTVPGTAVLLGLWAAVPVATATLVYGGLLHPALVLVPLAASAPAVLALLKVPVYAAPPRTSARRPGPVVPPASPAPDVTAPGGAVPGGARATSPARTAAGRPTVPPPPTGRPIVGLTADRN